MWCRDPRVHVQTVQLQGRDTVGSEPSHQVTDPLDEGAQRVCPVLGGICLANEPRATSTGQTSDVQLYRWSCSSCHQQRRGILTDASHSAWMWMWLLTTPARWYSLLVAEEWYLTVTYNQLEGALWAHWANQGLNVGENESSLFVICQVREQTEFFIDGAPMFGLSKERYRTWTAESVCGGLCSLPHQPGGLQSAVNSLSGDHGDASPSLHSVDSRWRLLALH